MQYRLPLAVAKALFELLVRICLILHACFNSCCTVVTAFCLFCPPQSRIVACAQRFADLRWIDMGFCVSSVSTVLSVSPSWSCNYTTAVSSLSLHGRHKQRCQATCNPLSASNSSVCGSGSSVNLPSTTAAQSWVRSHIKSKGTFRRASCSSLIGHGARHGRADPTVSLVATLHTQVRSVSIHRNLLSCI